MSILPERNFQQQNKDKGKAYPHGFNKDKHNVENAFELYYCLNEYSYPIIAITNLKDEICTSNPKI